MESAGEVQLAPPLVDNRPQAIAPLWHALLLVAVIVLFSGLGADSQHKVGEGHRELLYISTIVVEWIMFAYVWWSIRHSKRTTLREVIGGRWSTPEDFLIDVAITAGFWIAALLVLTGLGYALGLTGHANLEQTKKAIGFLAPQTLRQAILFGCLCITAGFCEESIFRGYLQRQFGALARNAYVGIILSAIIFGLGHGYQGPKRMLLIGVYGVMFGVLAHFRKSLRPGMMAHAWHDGFTGAILYFVSKMKV